MASFCQSCGAAIDAGSRFCRACGSPVAEGVVPAATPAPPLPQPPPQHAPPSAAPWQASPQPSAPWVPGAATAAARGGSALPKILGAIALLIVGVIVVALVATSGPADAVTAHFAALAKGDDAAAYALTSSGFRSETSVAQFTAFVAANPILSRGKLSIGEREVSGDIGTVTAELTATDGTKRTLDVQLVKESGEWKIAAYRIRAAGAPAPSATRAAQPTPAAQTVDALAVLKATKFVYFEASAFQGPQGGPIYVTFHQPLPVTWTATSIGLIFSGTVTWTYVSAGANVEQQMDISGAVTPDGKSLRQLTVSEAYTLVGSGVGSRLTMLEFANIASTAVKNDPAAGPTWLAASKVPEAKALLTSAGSMIGATGLKPLTWPTGGISIGFSEKSQKFELKP